MAFSWTCSVDWYAVVGPRRASERETERERERESERERVRERVRESVRERDTEGEGEGGRGREREKLTLGAVVDAVVHILVVGQELLQRALNHLAAGKISGGRSVGHKCCLLLWF